MLAAVGAARLAVADAASATDTTRHPPLGATDAATASSTPDVGLALVEDLETGELVEVDTGDPRVRQAFAHEVLRQRALRERLFRKLRVDHLTVHTDEDYVRPIAEFFRFRQKRMMGFR